jgi:Phosphotransferase enzyme family
VRPLPSSWLANHAITVADRRDRRHRLVLRRWARPGWDLDDPDYTAQREATILELLAGSRPPALFLAQLAGALPAIHAVDGRARDLVPSYRTYVRLDGLAMPDRVPPTRIWQRALELAAGPSPETHGCFIHRDYHHHNTLWARGRLTGVVDWTQASWGPASVDLGHMRWNLALDYGIQAAEEFLAVHEALTGGGIRHHPYWDVVTVIDLVGDIDPADPLPSRDVSALEAYLAVALARL